MTTPEQIAREAAEKLLHESDRIVRETATDEEAVDEGAKIILDAIRRAVRDTGAVEALESCEVTTTEDGNIDLYFQEDIVGIALAKLKAIAGEE